MTDLKALCGAIDRARLARDSVERIRRELPTYRTIELDEHLAAVALQQGNQLDAMAQGRVVAGQALVQAAALARLRAHQNVDVEVLIGAFHLGDQVLWQALVESSDPGTASSLPRAASLLLASLHSLSTALTAAHAEASQAQQSRRITASQRLFELLVAGRVDAETRTHARLLGLDVEAGFVAVAVAADSESDAALSRRLTSRLAEAGGTAVSADLSSTLVLCQGLSLARVVEVVRGTGLVGMAGIGLERVGLSGALLSLGDARLALLVDGPRVHDAVSAPMGLQVTEFADVWPDACVRQESSRLEPVLLQAVAVAREHPHLADAVRAFARGDMHVARAAQSLNLHANSLGYRLDRWATLAQWDPRTFDGLRRSVAAIASANERSRPVELLDEP